jgi:glutamyl-Q tRNA(Asp) synthetase
MTDARLRFAPSPNGRLHLGHAYSALLNDQVARGLGGSFLLRIEDIDFGRSRPEYVEAICADLNWLGLRWESPVRRQSEHFRDYIAAAGELKRRGLLYPCFCTRRDVAAAVEAWEATDEPAPRDPDGSPLYPGLCRFITPDVAAARMAAGEAHAWRLDMAKALEASGPPHHYIRFEPAGAQEAVLARPDRWGDAVIVRKETPTSYHLSVVVDDAIQRITHVVRGRDLEAATDLHVLLQALLNLPSPLYHHHALIEDTSGNKLSKSLISETLAEMRAAGVTASHIRRMLGFSANPEHAQPDNAAGEGQRSREGDGS